MESKKNSKRKNNRMRLLVLAVVLVLLYVLGAPCAKDMFGIGGDKNDIYMEIAQGATLKEITSDLEEKGIVSNPTLFYIYAKNKAANFKFGGHIFNTSMSYGEICDSLCENGKTETVNVLVPEGYELRLIAEACEEKGLVSAEEFMKVAENGDFDYDFLVDKKGVNYKLEGFLFPATYEFSYGMSAYDIIDTMLRSFDDVYTDEYSARAKELGMSDYDVVTLASVIEREAASVEEHKKVSGVFYNRIKKGQKLESCATVQYILKERKPVLSVADTKIDSPYNTYMYAGLPVGPVASPSKSAIEAALYPESHDYYFFVAKADGNGHVFSKTFSEHEKAVAENQ